MSVKQIVFLVIIVATAVFVLQNTQVVEVRLLFWKVSAVRAVVLTLTFLLGMTAGFLLKLFWRRNPRP